MDGYDPSLRDIANSLDQAQRRELEALDTSSTTQATEVLDSLVAMDLAALDSGTYTVTELGHAVAEYRRWVGYG